MDDLIQDMRDLAEAHSNAGGCTEEGCGCPGSRLMQLVRELEEEFGSICGIPK